jgi:hypothetical protein
MGKCVQCGNDYDKSFEVRMDGRTSRRCVRIAAAASSATACSTAIQSSAASIAPSMRESKGSATAIS